MSSSIDNSQNSNGSGQELDEYRDPDFNEDDNSESPPTDIVAYNELRSCADLARMSGEGVIDLQPYFQRDVVWSPIDQTRFIDSLVKQLPIPSMCFALDHKTDTWIVIDGLQRMTSIVNFISGGDWKLSRLPDIDPRLSGVVTAAFKTGTGDRKRIFDRVQNKTLPITVLRCDFSKKNHMEYIFTIFHRLNSGGSKLNNQEIRNCIYSGSFNTFLKHLDRDPSWRRLNNMVPAALDLKISTNNYRYVKQELILRLFAFIDRPSKYSGQVAKFLNDYMHDHREPKDGFIKAKQEMFTGTMSIIDRIFPSRPGGKLPTAVVEAMLVGIARNIDHATALSDGELQSRYASLRAASPFNEEGLSEGLSKKDKVDSRFSEATRLFSF